MTEWNLCEGRVPAGGNGYLAPKPCNKSSQVLFPLAKGYIPNMTKLKGPSKKRGYRVKLPSVTLAYLAPRSPSLVHEEWFWSVLQTVAHASGKAQIRPIGIRTGPLLSRARNKLVQSFLETDDEYLLFTDTDIIFSFDDLDYLLSESFSRPIIASVYHALDAQNNLVCAHLDELPDEPGSYRDVPLEQLADEGGAARDPFRVSGVGMGFTLIRREVLEALSPTKRLYPFAETNEEKCYGEDLTFCLRAAEKGYYSYVAPKSRVGHIKEVVL